MWKIQQMFRKLLESFWENAGVWHHHKVSCHAPIRRERVRHGLWVLVEVTLDGTPNIHIVGDGEFGPAKTNIDETYLRMSWLEVAGSISGQICAWRLCSEDPRSKGPEVWSKEAQRSEMGSLLRDARSGRE
ncbi:hypothetical protein L484_019945 [Morus notabilis]|uniref:Uncharacterized protein n=1 Tax=Morus notabilis TaxID=981085 RepID=W9R7J0_9ROSA|nr:hypothetical protein L484_019945 [Morus notabilis]